VVGAQVVLHSALDHGLLYLKARPRSAVDDLSSREFLVAQLLSSGLTQKDVAAKLGRSPHTINSQIKVCFEKLQITSVSQLAEHLVLR
jgi:DNA-binding NarL/FixJ family response regulator